MKTFLRTIISITICAMLVSGIKVYALSESTSYTNDNGIKLTEKEYNFVNEFYGNGFFDNMTQEDYEWIKDLNINTNHIETKTVYSNDFDRNIIQPYGSSYSTNSKKLTIVKSCSSICTIITNLTWLVNPNIRSYDVIGARFFNTSLADNTIITRLTSSNGTEYSSNNKVLSNGLGTSVKLPSGATNISVQQKFFTKLGGTIYASYQHSTSNITLQTSLSYSIGIGGYGNVFLFYSGAVGKFDQMNGVNINL